MKPALGIFAIALVTPGWSAPQKIGKATRAQIEAVLPASLRVKERPDPAAEARYARSEALGSKKYGPVVDRGLGASASAEDRAAAVRIARPSLLQLDRILNGRLQTK